ncbi:MAG: radical SAM protein [Candidatus Aminicenantes bacterium]
MQMIQLPVNTICYRVVRQCNLSCPFCQTIPDDKELSFSEHQQVLKLLYSTGINSVKFTGGEPYTNEHFNDLIDFSKKLGMEVTVCTNSTILRKKDFDVLRKNNCKLKISLHGLKGIHNKLTNSHTEKRVTKNIIMAAKMNIPTSIHFMLTRFNLDIIDDLFLFAIKNNIWKITIIPFVNRGRGQNLKWGLQPKKLMEIMAAKKKKYGKYLKVSFLDLFKKPYYVVETDGILYTQFELEAMDKKIYDLRHHII